jgi:membrane fusion protein (multidrug efflux system)
VELAVGAERHGFESAVVSDHFQPWRHTGGHAPFSLAWLAAAGERTSTIRLGTSVMTPHYRYTPAVIAQACEEEAARINADRVICEKQLAEAEANLLESRNQFNRGRDLSVTQALSKAQLDQLETAVKTGEARVAAAKARLADTVIRAPFAGRTGFRRVSLGGLVNPGSVITTLDDTSIIKLEFSVSQTYLNDLQPGLAVEAVAEGLGERVFGGKISAIDSRVDPVTRSVTVRAELPNTNGDIKPGLFMKVRVRGAEKPTLMIPEEALVPEQGRTYVFVVEGGEAKRREVRIGGREPGSVAITSGLAGNETLVVEGMQRIRDGARVTATARS